MEYNYFAETTTPSYSLFSYGSDLTALPHNVDTISNIAYPIDTIGTTELLDSNLEESLNYNGNAINIHHPPITDLSMPTNNSIDSGIGFDLETDMPQERRGSSEEKDNMTPAQSRRKAQNRAAQRAFRERKERHVRDLEAKLNILTTTTTALQSDNERLKVLLRKVQNENEMLRSAATSTASQPFINEQSNRVSRSVSRSTTSGIESTSTSNSSVSEMPQLEHTSWRSLSDRPLLSASATWDFLQSHPKYVSGAVDIGKVCERLKRLARVDGSGPMFDQAEVRRVIEEVDGNGADELL